MGKKTEIIGKAEQVRALIDGTLFEVLRSRVADFDASDYRDFLTFTRRDLINYLSENPELVMRYFKEHEGIRSTHDVPTMTQVSSEAYKVGWMDRGVLRHEKTFVSLPEAVTEFLFLSLGMY